MNVLLAADTGGSYVAAAFLVFIIVLVIYVGVMASKLVRMQHELSDIRKKTDSSQDSPE